MNQPKDHHYIPIFYLSRWAGDDGMVCRFSRPYGSTVKPKRIVPKGTAYEPHLYAVNNLPEDQAQAMEREFMSSLDSRAAIALEMLENGSPDSQWDLRKRSDWTRFLWAQSLRTPQDIKQLKAMATEAWRQKITHLQSIYQIERSEDDPVCFEEYLSQIDPGHDDRFALDIAKKLMDHGGIGQLINNMYWKVLNFQDEAVPILTSDRPVWMTPSLIEPDSFITMPIGPKRIFVAATRKTTLKRLEVQNQNQLVKNINKISVQHAINFVYGINELMLPFIQKHMSTKRHSTHFERLAKMNNLGIVDPQSPAGRS